MSDNSDANSHTLEPGKDRRWQYMVRALTAGMVVLLLIFVGLAIYWLARPTPFDPLSFPTVLIREVKDDGTIVIPQVPGADAPSIFVNEVLPTVFQYCSNADDDFSAIGNSWFVNADTGDRYTLNQNISSVIHPGCVAPRVDIAVPAQVRIDLLEPSSGNKPSGLTSPWYIEGELTPTRQGGVTAKWRSEIFYIVAADKE